MSLDFQCTIHDPARKALWERWLGTETVPVRSFVPTQAHIDGREPETVFVLDATALTLEERHRMVSGLAEHFQAPLEEVAASLDTPGIAIPSAACSVMVLNMQRWV